MRPTNRAIDKNEIVDQYLYWLEYHVPMVSRHYFDEAHIGGPYAKCNACGDPSWMHSPICHNKTILELHKANIHSAESINVALAAADYINQHGAFGGLEPIEFILKICGEDTKDWPPTLSSILDRNI